MASGAYAYDIKTWQCLRTNQGPTTPHLLPSDKSVLDYLEACHKGADCVITVTCGNRKPQQSNRLVEIAQTFQFPVHEVIGTDCNSCFGQLKPCTVLRFFPVVEHFAIEIKKLFK